jgi:hypothetical protein
MTMLIGVLCLNLLWFIAGFRLFALKGNDFAKIIIPKEDLSSPILEHLLMAGKFLGGFNLAFAFLNLMLLLNPSLFDQPGQWSLFLFVNTIAHGSQFAFNWPVFIQNRSGKGVWEIKGQMLFIFIVDFLLMSSNLILGLKYFLS